MRTDDEGEPLVHKVQSDTEVMREAQTGVDALLRQVQDAKARTRAINTDLDVILKRKLAVAVAVAERMEWRPIASVAMFETQRCSHCGNEQALFRGFGTKFNRRHDNVERMEKADCLDASLQFQRMILGTSTVSVCILCVDEQAAEGKLTVPWKFEPKRKGE